jgi:protein-S-isoprenylcysteine O-methyltransferase Ste14
MTALETRVPPLLLVLIVGAMMVALAHLVGEADFAIPGRLGISIACIVLGMLVAACGVFSFHRHQTTVDPLKPEKAQALVTTGIYQVSRNPMYLGFLLALLGWAIYLSNFAAALLLPAFVLYMNRFQIGPEERILSGKFGSSFDSYMKRVRRWF